MKKIRYTLLLVLSVMVLTSCKKDDPTEPQVVDDPTEPQVVDTPAFTLKIDGEEVEANTQATALLKSYNVVGVDGELGFNITNNINEEIKLRMTVVDINGNGDGIQICFGFCSTSVALDDTQVRSFAIGETTTGNQTHVYNDQVGNRDFECTIKINQVDESGTDIGNGKEVYFTYKYVAP